MTTETIATGWFLIGAVFTLVVLGLSWLIRELWSEYLAGAKNATKDPEAIARSVGVMVDNSQQAGLHLVQAMDRVKVPEQYDGRWS